MNLFRLHRGYLELCRFYLEHMRPGTKDLDVISALMGNSVNQSYANGIH